MKKFLNVLAILLAFVLSIVLTVLLIAAPFASAALDLLQPEELHGFVSGLDLEELTEEVDELEETVGKFEDITNSEYLGKMLKSDFGKDLVEAILNSMKKGRDLRAKELLEITDEHMDELVELTGAYLSEVKDTYLSADKIEDNLTAYMEQNADELVKNFAFPEKMDDDVQDTVKFLMGDLPGFIIIAAATVLALLILLLRWSGFKGFKWLTTVFLLCAVVVAAPVLVLNIPDLMENAVPGMPGALAEPIIGFVNTHVLIDALWIAAAGLLCMAVALIGGAVLKHKARKAAVQSAPVVAVPVQPVAAAAQPVAVAAPVQSVAVPDPVPVEPEPPAEPAAAEPATEATAGEETPMEEEPVKSEE